MTLDVATLDHALLVGAAVLLLAVLAVRVSVAVGLPGLLVYLLIGVALGESGLGISFDNPEAASALSFAALVVILAEGGLITPWQNVRPVLRLGVALATVGLLASVTVVALFAHYALDLPWQLAILLGAATSSTDAAAVFSVLRRVPVPHRLTGTLEAESGLNDAPVVVLVTLFSQSGHHTAFAFIGEVLYELGLGAVGGLAVGFAGVWLMRRVALPASGLYPIAVLALAFLAYAGVAVLHGSGFAAVYVAALVLGNGELPHRVATRSFAEGLAWLSQIGLFVMLGLLASPGRFTWHVVAYALLAGAVLTFLARPVSVMVASVVQRLPVRELGFLSWAGLRGAVPIVLATVPLAHHVRGATQVFDIVFVMVVIYTLLTGPTLPWVGRRLGVISPEEPHDLEMEVAPLDRIAADLIQFTISPDSLMHGVEVGELRLPGGASVSLVVRGGEVMVPEDRTVLHHDDGLLVVTPHKARERVERRLHQISRGGRLGHWLQA